MAVTLLQVLVLGAIAAAADDVPVTWSSSSRALLPCVVPLSEKILRRPPPPLEAEDDVKYEPYVWWKDGEEIRRSPSNITLDVMRNDDESSEGVYWCGVEYSKSVVLGYPINLKFANFGKFTVHPANGTAKVNQPYVLSCDVLSRPSAAVSWMKDGKVLPKSNRYNAIQNQLIILDVKQEDAGLYRCKATNTVLNKTKISQAGRVEVVDSPQELAPALLPINFTSNIEAPKGSWISLPCPIAGWPRPKLKWEFTPPGQRTQEWEDVTEVFSRSLDFDLEGVYTCSVEGNSAIAKTFNVTVTEPVQIIVAPSPRQTPRASTVRFNCTAVGRPTPDVTWYKDGKPLVLSGRNAAKQISSPNASHLELLIRSVTSDDAGVYQCFAHNSVSVASAWALVSVNGEEASAPTGVRCWPGGIRTIFVRWDRVPGAVLAYTVHFTRPGANLLPGQPVNQTDNTITVAEPLTPYDFKVRAYLVTKTSDLSENVTCQGQGVPIKLTRLGEEEILVSWMQFAEETPGVLQWIVQYKTENGSDVHNVTLGSDFYEYTLNAQEPVQVRVLGTKMLPWLQQNLTMVPWTSSNVALRSVLSGGVEVVPKDVEVIGMEHDRFTVRWHCEEADLSPSLYKYQVCVRKIDGDEKCFSSQNTNVTVSNLKPGSKYEVRVRAQVRILWKQESNNDAVGPFSTPIFAYTQIKGLSRFRNLTYKSINATTIQILWGGPVDTYTVHYNTEMKPPINQWPSAEITGNSTVLTGLDLTKSLYVLVTASYPLISSSIMEIPPQVHDATDIKYAVTNGGVRVSWRGEGPRVVKYSQNLTQFLEKWPSIFATANNVDIEGLDPNLSTYVMVTIPGANQHSQVLTIPPLPEQDSYFSYYLGFGCFVLLLCVGLVAAFFVWRRRKRTMSPLRSRRRNVSPTDGNEEEAAEMKSVGERLANGGGPKDAGEPLLNGHVHITENPNQSKTPNGRMRKGRRYEPTFDMARYEDPDITLETVLDQDTSTSTTYNLLDTSRRPEYDVSDLSANNSFNKLPDDNMNSELTRSTNFQLDNSKIIPTLQPNG